jgi:hypothetical protein
MPVIKATAMLVNFTPPMNQTVRFDWNASLVFTGKGCPHFRKSPYSLALDIKASSTLNFTEAVLSLFFPEVLQPELWSNLTNDFTIPFTNVRGGQLTVSVTVTAGSTILKAKREGLLVVGTNPLKGSLTKELILADLQIANVMMKVMQHESGLKQFLTIGANTTSEHPLYSHDGYGGVGLCQITYPQPKADEIWSWKANLKAGVGVFHEKQDIARAYPQEVRSSSRFHQLVQKYNEVRKKNKLNPLNITLPDFTPEQVLIDAIRGYNGWIGGHHEYCLQVDAMDMLVVVVNENNISGVAQWERITPAMRSSWGMSDYVDGVLKETGIGVVGMVVGLIEDYGL